VKEFNASGTLVQTLTSGISNPLALAIDSSGNIYIANNNNTVEEFDTSGSLVRTLSNGILYPGALATDSNGNVYVANFMNDTVEEFDSLGSLVRTLSSGISYLRGLVIDSNGNVYVANNNMSTVEEFNASGSLVRILGVSSPHTLAIDSSGNLYIINSTVEKFLPSLTTYTSASDSNTQVTVTAGPAGVAGAPINLALSNPSGDINNPITFTVTGLPTAWTLNNGADNHHGAWTVQSYDPGNLTVITPSGYSGALNLKINETWTDANGISQSALVSENIEAYAPGSPIFAWSGNDNLTGSNGTDLFVFGQPIGNDIVYQFNSRVDIIDLFGFAGFNSFADVQAHLSTDANGNALITLADKKTITLQGIMSDRLTANNFEFNQAPITHNSGNMTIGDGAILPLGGIIDNTGSISLLSGGASTQLELVGGGLTLKGHGLMTLSDNSNNLITGAGINTLLTNIDNTILGAGNLGGAQLTLDNRSLIIADGAQALTLNTASNIITNSGTLESKGSGSMIVNSAVANSGELWAHGGTLTFNSTVSGGTALIDAGGKIEFGNTTSANITFGAVSPGLENTLKLNTAGLFTGTVSGFNAGDTIDLLNINATNATFNYTANGSSSLLSVTDGVHAASITLIGQPSGGTFYLAVDATGGTTVTYH
jgi:hypothetical protein